MKNIYLSVLILSLAISACKSNSEEKSSTKEQPSKELKTSFKIALGSCNRQGKPQDYWSVIEKDSADVFIWGGDNIYADTPDMDKMDSMYNVQKNNRYYQSFVKSLPNSVLGVWDDHDYGKNDAGKDWVYKDQAKALYMNFLDIDSTHAMANRKGTYYTKSFKAGNKEIKVFLLDSRYFREGLREAEDSDKRYQPHTTSDSTLLGSEQWSWLKDEMKSSDADFNIFVSSIQFLSNEHGFETWGNFPHEVRKMEDLLKENQLKNVLFLSGDRHISEFSQKDIEGLDYPLTDFTSSGLTHSYTSYDNEPNPYRIGEVTAQTSYGIVDIDLNAETASLNIKSTEDGRMLQNLELTF